MAAAPSLKYQAALSIAYAAGLRASEVISLKVGDIDSARMLIRNYPRKTSPWLAPPVPVCGWATGVVGHMGNRLPTHTAAATTRIGGMVHKIAWLA